MLIPNLLRNSNLIIDTVSYHHSERQDTLKEGQIESQEMSHFVRAFSKIK
jgi:hypothetical protein